MKNKDLKTYASLARIGFPKSFSGKLMLVVFAGTHLPLVVLVLYLLLATPGGLETHSGVLAALLIATLLGFVATLFALRALLAPVRLASSSLGGATFTTASASQGAGPSVAPASS